MAKHGHGVMRHEYEYINFLMTLVWEFHAAKRLTITAVGHDKNVLNVGGTEYTLEFIALQFIIAEGFAVRYPIVTEFYTAFYEEGFLDSTEDLLRRLVAVTGLKKY